MLMLCCAIVYLRLMREASMSRSACLSINSDEAGVESCELVKIYTSRQQELRGAIGAHRANGRRRTEGRADKIIPSRLVKGGGYYI